MIQQFKWWLFQKLMHSLMQDRKWLEIIALFWREYRLRYNEEPAPTALHSITEEFTERAITDIREVELENKLREVHAQHEADFIRGRVAVREKHLS